MTEVNLLKDFYLREIYDDDWGCPLCLSRFETVWLAECHVVMEHKGSWLAKVFTDYSTWGGGNA